VAFENFAGDFKVPVVFKTDQAHVSIALIFGVCEGITKQNMD